MMGTPCHVPIVLLNRRKIKRVSRASAAQRRAPVHPGENAGCSDTTLVGAICIRRFRHVQA